MNFNNINSVYRDWKVFNEIIIKKHLFKNLLLILYLWLLNQQRKSSFKSTQKNQNKSCCKRAWNCSKCKQQSFECFDSSFFLHLNIINCNLFMIFSKLIEYFLMSLTISFATWWFLIPSINWFIVSFNHFRFINFMLFLTCSWYFFALIIKIFKSCHALLWWTADEYYAQILTSYMNSTAKFFKQLCCCNIRSRIVLNLW